jgi:hypothetical protein
MPRRSFGICDPNDPNYKECLEKGAATVIATTTQDGDGGFGRRRKRRSKKRRSKKRTHSFGSPMGLGKYLPGRDSSHLTLLLCLAFVFLIRIGLIVGADARAIKQEIKNLEFGLLFTLTFESVMDLIQYLGNKAGYDIDRGIIFLCYMIIFSLTGAASNV